MSLLQALNLPPLPPQAAAAVAAKAAAAKANDSAAAAGALTQAARAWLDAQRTARERIEALKQAVGARCAGLPPPAAKQVNAGLSRLDKIAAVADPLVAQALENANKAGQAADAAARDAALKTARVLLDRCAAALSGEALVAHADANPFGVQTGLAALFGEAIAEARAALG